MNIRISALRRPLAAAASAALISVIGSIPAANATTTPAIWHEVFQATLPYSNTLVSVEATSQTDQWAVGVADSGAPRAYAVHWTGTVWKVTPFQDRTFVPVSVRASSAHNVWVFGSDSTHALEALRWDGTHWLPALPIPAGAPDNPVVLGPTDVWLSYFATWTRARGWTTTSWHWDGQEWHTYTLPMLTTDMGVAGSSDQNLWAAGLTTTSSNRNALGHLATYRWNGHAWHRIRLPRAFLVRDPELAASASGETWIVAGGSKHVHGHAVVLYRGASTWHQLEERRLSVSDHEIEQ